MKEKNKKNKYPGWFAAFVYPVTVGKNKMAGASMGDPAKSDSFRKFLSGFLFIASKVLLRWLFSIALVFVPSIIISRIRPGLLESYEVTSVFIWFWMITIRESLVCTSVLKIKKADRVMFRSFCISPGDNFLGKFKFKMLIEICSHFVIMLIFRISVYHAICLTLITLFFRVIGERRELKSFQKYETINVDKRYKTNKIRTTVCICAAYGFPLAVGIMAGGWYWLIHPLVLAFLCAKILLDWRYLRKYKNYDYVIADIISRGVA